MTAALAVREVDIERTRPLRQAVLRPHETVAQLAREEPHDAFAVAAFDGDELIGVGIVAPDGDPGGWRIRGMATVPSARRRGAGTAVLEALLAHARERGARRVWCNARTPAVAFYERPGMRVSSERFELPHIGPHVVMELAIEG